MRRSSKQRGDTTPEREALLAVIHECEAFIHLADWSPLTERSHRSITQMMGIIKGVALATRKLAQFDGGKRVPATMCAIADAVRWAEEILKEVDSRCPVKQS
jgi:hypothetical protein